MFAPMRRRENGSVDLQVRQKKGDQRTTVDTSFQEDGISAERQFLNALRKFPLLTPGQEVELAKAREAGIEAKLELAKLQEPNQDSTANCEGLSDLQQCAKVRRSTR